MHGRKADEILISEDPVMLDDLLAAIASPETIESTVMETAAEPEPESIITV